MAGEDGDLNGEFKIRGNLPKMTLKIIQYIDVKCGFEFT